jgi:hypothetical protein
MQLVNRITWACDYETDRVVFRAVADRKGIGGETILFEISEPFPYPIKDENTREQNKAIYRVINAVENRVLDWLKEHYPDYKNPYAYWDIEL